MPPQPGESRDAVHWFVDSLGLYQGSARGLFLSDYSEDQEALIESAVINFKSRGVKSLVIAGEMLYKQADYLYQHAAAQTTFGRPLLSQLELDMIDADVLIVTDLVAPETPQQLWYFYHHLLYPRAMAQKPLILTTPLSLDEFLSYGAACDDLEYAGRRVTWEKVAWLMDGMLIDLHHFRMLKGENLPPMLKAEYFLYKALISRGLVVTPQYVLGDYMLDFAMVERGNKLAVECDLLASLDNPNARSSEAKRTLVLLSDGWKLLRFTVVDLLANLMDCVDAVADVWVTGRKKSPSGRLVSGQANSHLVDLPVEDDIERRAITYGAGPIAITGGAGTGKSTCVARRVAHLLSQGVNPERILVISHSTESARSLRAELENLIDKPSLQRLHFHSWNELGLKLLKENTNAIKRKPPLKVEGNPQRVIQRLLAKYKRDLDQMTLEMAEELEEFTLASLISLYKANLITPKHVKDRAKNSVDELVARVYQGYEEQLQKSNKIDRDDMVTMAAQLLADNADIRARYQYQFEFVLVDEYQDANAAADLLLRMLALPQDNLFISGDEDQSIYESKGSLPKLIAEVSLRLPNARCFVLENNWRSHPDIVELANRLLTGMSRRRIRKEMVPGWEMSGDRAVVGPQLAETEAAEAEWVAVEIESLLASGRNPQDIAILYRYNRYASLVEEALFRRGIKCLTTNPDSTMVPDEVADIMAFLRLVMDPDGPKARESFERVCQLRTKEVDPRLFNTIASFAEANNLSFLKAVEIYSEAVADQSCQDLEQLVRIIRTMNHENLPPAETIALLKRTQRLSEYYKAVKVPPGVNYEPMRKLTQLEEEARKFKTVGDFVRSQTSPKAAEGQAEPLVFILSLHESKGKEFPVVFLTGMAEGLFPSETASDPEEERRLCYLGMTRAKDMLYVSYPGKFNDVVLAPSRFLLETMQDATPRPVSVAAAPSPTTLAKPAVSTASAPAQSAQQEAALRAQQEAAQRAQQEAALKVQQEAAQRAQQEAALKAQQEAAQRAQQEAALRAQQEAALKAQQEAALRAQQEAALRAQQEAALRAQQEAALRAQQEAALRAQQEAALRAQQEAALRAQQEAALKAQQEAALRAQQEAALRAQQEAALRAQQEAALRAQQEAAQKEAALRAQQEAELRAQQEAALRAQQEAALRAQQEAALRAQQEAALRAQQEAEIRAQQEALKMQEASVRAQQEAALRAQQEAALRAQQEAALRAQQEAALRAQQEAALRAQQEAALRAQQEAALRAQQEAALRAQQEAVLRAQQEAALKAQQEAALNEEAAKEEAARKAKMEELQRAQQEEEQRAREQNESGKKGKGRKKAQAREEEKISASDVRDVAVGLPPQSTPQPENAFSMPPAAQADASEDAFWQSVNSFSGGEIKPGGKAGVPTGVTAPIPQPDMPVQYQPVVPQVPVYNPVQEAQAAQARPAQELCPGCSEPLDPGSRFCGECGFRLETKIISCHLCGAPQEGDAKFCGECGSKLHDNKAAPAAPDAGSPLSTYEGYLSGQKPSQAGWVTRLKKIVE